ncbi:hypothetical protein PHYBLDRAFT_153588 [Phycomyces blakesleeanus NRRL 1555(-)]|uniref:Uncharacterized protein n=1 Tax=Phycomyces blakesleeanus (strain ATCC 8743b / DSM 1359 / FGSC 10004 / NBRC 33097 / NRRL 1555) TaxID=763407 RepID=A0A167J712_PHYB8|nr:hypothetical protein PHYBLDRAFT_153588 [Phycomyces blakesleeanus NRRL 1555(-)]OAD65338.1 hypothetical protein PHYBLDRAFT_153588 [Phycomyces blakesleeanus NRRL 1555(-)]|eukprot:XP_018283378.1 hypothetical protein PHYBLDRAFT_153588 [Phycomyces blakesleeanus NRRL 1555(-)]
MANNCQSIALALFLEYAELLRRLIAIEESLKTNDLNIDIVIKGKTDSLKILDNIANTSGQLLAIIAPTTVPASATASVVPSVVSVVLTGVNAGKLSKQDRSRVLALIQRELKKHNFKSNKLELVAVNDSKHSWDINVDYRLTPNRQLIHDLHAYLAPKVVGTSTNSWSRKAGQETNHFDHCELTYHTFKAEIYVKMGKSCNRLLQKEAMSEDESEDDMPGDSCNHAIRTYNHFLAVVDDFMHNRMDFNLRQMLKRFFSKDTVLVVPPRLMSLFPHWAFRDKFQ